MYIVTFYSYKGGVGRTLALVNIAVCLAQAGRRVLLVDFDLEAPGIDTFNLPRPRGRQPGVVEYVTEYVETGAAPDVSRFVYKSPESGTAEGGLWIMPAGEIDASYGARFNAINWQELYEHRDGYLLFEDLKSQWDKQIQPDYVLIDSRTGHTDVGGICTRHLPDAVVLLFFPNEQNRRGIARVAHEIRREAEPPRKKNIRLHFVMSNVPELDDEEKVLEEFVSRFREEMVLQDEPLTIHHYPSLDLVEQGVFVVTHPNSRLTRQYHRLADLIKAHNLEDPDGAIAFLSRNLAMLRRSDRRVKAAKFAEYLQTIRTKHDDNPKVLLLVGEALQRIGQTEDASGTFNQAEAAGMRSPYLWLAQAECRDELGDRDGARDAALTLLGHDGATDYHVNQAINLLGRTSPEMLAKVTDFSAVNRLTHDERLWVAKQVGEWDAGLVGAHSILSSLHADDATPEPLRSMVEQELVLCSIGLRRFDEAISLIGDVRAPESNPDIDEVFNYAMAEWGVGSEPPRDLFARVLEMHAESPKTHDAPNYFQCLAMCCWVVADNSVAEEWVQRARQRMLSKLSPDFSCWTYRMAKVPTFLAHLEEFEAMVAGAGTAPAFLHGDRDAANSNEDERRACDV